MSAQHTSYGGDAPVMLGVTWTMAAIGTFLVLLRAYAARSYSGKPRWDFIWVVIGAIFGLACQVGITLQCLHGVGNHITNVSINDIWASLYLTFVGISLGLCGNTGAKLSIVALLLQITPREVHPKRRQVLWGIGIFCSVVNMIQIILVWTQCDPVNKVWDIILPGVCKTTKAANDFSYFQGATAVITDAFLALYPTTVVWDLKLSYRTKIGFCVLMAGGLLPAVAGIVRTIYSHRMLSSSDITWELVPFLMWSDTEMWFVIILGSVPPLRPLFERVILGRVNLSSRDRRSTNRRSTTMGNNGVAPRTGGSAEKTNGESAIVTVVSVAA
ncbi:hypothetical protein K461DRAFT_267742 [Myriangium duriaei CBS 260.36]|uniref:Rhodopsin domain-containing protein n=1 Tax=Myriangium duriaei CBS 260.36 TaxID=1168546 RepID=A0A9P4MMU8_9PEZI|nr:hypothetical protein K461DRAFT_267742 [Myriangium duriaei CBS 260.36]